MTAFVANTNILELRGLKDGITGVFINDADVLVTLETDAGVEVGPVSWPITMSYVPTSDGIYRATIGSELDLVAGGCYKAIIEADAGVDRIGHWDFAFVPLTRIR